jgi:hypothetical protein
MPSYPTTKKLITDLNAADKAVEQAREAIIREIRRRMGDVTPYQFAAASGINRGNLYNLVSNGKWNKAVAISALELLSTPLSDRERERARLRANASLEER